MFIIFIIPPVEVNFVYEEQEMTVAIPQGYNVGQQALDCQGHASCVRRC